MGNSVQGKTMLQIDLIGIDYTPQVKQGHYYHIHCKILLKCAFYRK